MSHVIRYFVFAFFSWAFLQSSSAASLVQQNEVLFLELQKQHGLSQEQMQRIRAIFKQSGVIGQGNPAISNHPQTPEQCVANRTAVMIADDSRAFEQICGGPNLAPLFDPETQNISDAKTCIDQYEFPNIACNYPVVWVRAREAAQVCEVMGKRLCDAHEWEGACEGRLLAPDYRFDLARGVAPDEALRRISRVSQPARCLRSAWQCGRTHELADQRITDGQFVQYFAGLHRNEGQLVCLRPVSRPRRLVPMASAVLAWQPGDGYAFPCELSSRVPLLQEPCAAPALNPERHSGFSLVLSCSQ